MQLPHGAASAFGGGGGVLWVVDWRVPSQSLLPAAADLNQWAHRSRSILSSSTTPPMLLSTIVIVRVRVADVSSKLFRGVGCSIQELVKLLKRNSIIYKPYQVKKLI